MKKVDFDAYQLSLDFNRIEKEKGENVSKLIMAQILEFTEQLSAVTISNVEKIEMKFAIN